MKNKIKKLFTFKAILIILLIIGIYYLFKISNQLEVLNQHSEWTRSDVSKIQLQLQREEQSKTGIPIYH